MRIFFVFALLLASTFAAQAAPMQKWEYCTLERRSFSSDWRQHTFTSSDGYIKKIDVNTVDFLNQLGKSGWQVTTCAGDRFGLFWTLKRPFNPPTKKKVAKKK